MSSPRTLIVGLDSFDPELATALAREGRLPAIAGMLADGARASSRSPYGIFVCSLWPTLATSRSAEHVGYHTWLEVDPQAKERRFISPEIDGPPFWRLIGDAGKRVVAIDVPHARAGGDTDGAVELTEWGCHDRHFGLRSSPPQLAGQLVERYGLHPVLGLHAEEVRDFAPDDEFARAGNERTEAEDHELLEGLLAGIDAKQALCEDVLDREPWDLYLAVFGESHAAGHHFWHHHDRSHPRHDAGAAERLGDPLVRIYERLDRALAALLDRAGPDTTVVVLLSHGIGAHHDGSHLLDEVLRRLDVFESDGPGAAGAAKRMLLRAGPRVRRGLRRPAAAAARRAAARRELVNWWGETGDHDWSGQRWYVSPNNTVYGGVRLNVRGRERDGLIEPGREFDEACTRLADDLLELVNVETSEPVIHGVSRTDEHYERTPGDTLPDLFLDWNHEQPVNTVWSLKTGIIHGRYDLWRSGDHRLDGMLLARGPGITGGPQADVRTIDFGPSIAARLGVALSEVDGEPVAWLARNGR